MTTLTNFPTDILAHLINLIFPLDLFELVLSCKTLQAQISNQTVQRIVERKKKRLAFAKYIVSKIHVFDNRGFPFLDNYYDLVPSRNMFPGKITSTVTKFLLTRKIMNVPNFRTNEFTNAGYMIAHMLMNNIESFENDTYEYVVIPFESCLKVYIGFISKCTWSYSEPGTFDSQLKWFYQPSEDGDKLCIRRDEVLNLLKMWETAPDAPEDDAWFQTMKHQLVEMLITVILNHFEL